MGLLRSAFPVVVVLTTLGSCSVDRAGTVTGVEPGADGAAGGNGGNGGYGGTPGDDGAATNDASGGEGGRDASFDAHVPRDSGNVDSGCNQAGCPCTGNDPSTCYFGDEVCVVSDSGSGTCTQCGATGTNGLRCASGGSCDQGQCD